MDEPQLLAERHGGCLLLTLNRPNKLNALSPEMMSALVAAVGEAREDDAVKAVVITGAGRAWCVGADLTAPRPDPAERPWRRPHGESYPHLAMRHCDKPVIGAINGHAVGGGFGLALACDVLFAAEIASFAAMQVKRGLMSDFGLTYLLPRAVGTQKALQLLLTGDRIDAAEALRLGIVTEVLPPDALLDGALAFAARLAAGPPIALSLTKRAVYKAMGTDLETALEFESFGVNRCFLTQDAREGMRAFVEKREPVFQGR